MGDNKRIKGKWLDALPFIKKLFSERIEDIEARKVEVSQPRKTVRQLRKGIEGHDVKPRYVASFIDVFKGKREKLEHQVGQAKDKEHRKRLQKELATLDKAIAQVELAVQEEGKDAQNRK